jgi:hypothetical protein
MTFRIIGLESAPFEHLFGLPDEALARHRAKRYTADSKPGFPCRVTLEDAEPGETVILAPYAHQTAETAYAAQGPIFVRERRTRAATFIGEVPEQLAARMISLRAYDDAGMMIDADVVDGKALKPLIERFLENPATRYGHAHFARRGCYAARIERA